MSEYVLEVEDNHNWEFQSKINGTNRDNDAYLYICKKCGKPFRWYKNLLPNVYEALKYKKIDKKCIHPLDEIKL